QRRAATGPIATGTLRSLRAVGLSYAYDGGRPAIRDVSCMVAGGSFTVVTGRVGAGKTTLVRLLLGLLRRDAAVVTCNEAEVQGPAVFMTPPRCAYVPQIPRLFSASLRDNILLGEEPTDRLAEAIRVAVLDTDVRGFEHGLDTRIGSRGVRLSGGQVQRAA